MTATATASYGRGRGRVALEEYEHAKARGATIYAEVIGLRLSGDASTSPRRPRNGDGAYRACRLR
jgi:3-oxoacyl-[acyl-carrier-protein] synthase II